MKPTSEKRDRARETNTRQKLSQFIVIGVIATVMFGGVLTGTAAAGISHGQTECGSQTQTAAVTEDPDATQNIQFTLQDNGDDNGDNGDENGNETESPLDDTEADSFFDEVICDSPLAPIGAIAVAGWMSWFGLLGVYRLATGINDAGAKKPQKVEEGKQEIKGGVLSLVAAIMVPVLLQALEFIGIPAFTCLVDVIL